MRSAGNFHPEWGYLAPTPSFMRTARMALVATAIGATAGAGVVVSLVERPAADAADTSIAAHALVTNVPVATSPAAAVAVNEVAAAIAKAPVPPRPTVASLQSPQPTGGPAGGPVASANKATATSTPPPPASVAALAEAPPATAPVATPMPEEPAVTPQAAPVKKATSKKHRTAGNEAVRRWQAANTRKRWTRDDGGFGPLLRRLFSSRTGSSYYPN